LKEQTYELAAAAAVSIPASSLFPTHTRIASMARGRVAARLLLVAVLAAAWSGAAAQCVAGAVDTTAPPATGLNCSCDYGYTGDGKVV
jgi:hypothetical protein